MPRRADICYICGVAEATTSDHIFPKGLWPPPRPHDLVTGPACEGCQQRIEPDEAYFRTFVAAGSHAEPTARKLWEGKITRSFDRRPAFRQSFADALRTVDWKSPAGIYLGSLPGLEGDRTRIGNVLEKLVRGIFYLEQGRTVMPLDVRFTFEQVSPLGKPQPKEVMDVFHVLPLRTVGEIVRYKFGGFPENPRVTLTWMAFYGRTMFTVWTGPRDEDPDSSMSTP